MKYGMKRFLLPLRPLIFICLFVLFFIFFFKDYLTNYLERKTTFSSNYEDVVKLEFPTIIACVKLGYKDDAMKKYGFESVYDFPGKNQNNTSQMFDAVSFIHGADYEIDITSPISFERQNILTFRHGECHKMQPQEEILATQRVTLEVTWKIMEPKEIIFYLVSNDSWHGLCDDVLPYFHPSKFDTAPLDLDKPVRMNIPISMTDIEFMEGTNFADCITNIVNSINCSFMCLPFYLVSTTPIPLCETIDTHTCVESALYFDGSSVDELYKCHKPKHAKLYNPRPIEWNKHSEKNASLVYFYFESLSVLHKDEIFVISDLDLVGSVGGSLGLFLGFSFYSYILDFFQRLIEKFC